MAQNELTYGGYVGSIEASIEDECLHGRILFIDDLITYEGDTIAALKSSFEVSVDRYLAHCERIGKSPNKPYSGTFNVRIGPELHKQAAQAAYKAGLRLNEFVTNAVRQSVEMVSGIHINHHHEHEVKVTLQNPSEAIALELSASGAKPPRDWQKIETRH